MVLYTSTFLVGHPTIQTVDTHSIALFNTLPLSLSYTLAIILLICGSSFTQYSQILVMPATLTFDTNFQIARTLPLQ